MVVEYANRIASLEQQIAQLKKALIGPKSERTKMAPVPKRPATAQEQLETRRSNAEAKQQTQSVRVEHRVPEAQRACPACGNKRLRNVGKGRTTSVWEFVPARFIRVDHAQEVLKCRCGDYVVTAPGAPKVVEKGRYGASFLAHLAVQKCGAHMPIYRLEKEFRRSGFPLARSTMNQLLHRAAEIVRPISELILEMIRVRPIVQADETRMRMQNDGFGKAKNGFVWTFVSSDDAGGTDVALVFAADRSGETPRRVLGGTRGMLMVDAYCGYNAVEEVSSRKRAACHAHLRRYFHEALPTAPVGQEAIDLILELYRVEHEAADRGLSPAHRLKLRKKKSRPIRTRLRAWLERQQNLHPPKSPIAVAIRYGLKRWTDLGRFLEDGRVPLDNNASERALRPIALGRKNYLFVGDLEAGANVSVRQTAPGCDVTSTRLADDGRRHEAPRFLPHDHHPHQAGRQASLERGRGQGGPRRLRALW